MKKYKVKYSTSEYPNKIVFGLWDSSTDWVKWKMEQQNENGSRIQFLMSYDVNTEAQSRPEVKIVNIHPMGSCMTTEDWEDELEDS